MGLTSPENGEDGAGAGTGRADGREKGGHADDPDRAAPLNETFVCIRVCFRPLIPVPSGGTAAAASSHFEMQKGAFVRLSRFILARLVSRSVMNTLATGCASGRGKNMSFIL